MQVKSLRKYVRTAPDKIRILVSMIKNRPYAYALSQLEFADKDAAKPLILTLKQAKDLTKELNVHEDDIFVKEVRVDEGPKLKRRRILHRGRASMVLKRMSHITVVLSDDVVKKTQAVKQTKVEAKKDINAKPAVEKTKTATKAKKAKE